MGDLADRQMLLSLDGDQECSCCGIRPLSPDECEVIDLEVVCMDCAETYHPAVYARRTREP